MAIFIFEFILLSILGFYLYSEIIRPAYLLQRELKSSHWQNSYERFKKMPNNPDEIIFVGNSLTLLFDLSVFNNKKIINRGIGGDFTQGLILRLDEIIESPPAKIFFEIGINDILAKIPEKNIIENYQKIIATVRVKSPKTKIYIQSIFPVLLKNPVYISNKKANCEIISVNKSLKRICLEKGIVYIDLYSSFALNGSLNPQYSRDGVHLNQPGYFIWKKLVESFVNE